MLGNFPFFLLSADFFLKSTFLKIISGIRSECKTVWIQIRPKDMGPNCLQKLSVDNTSRQRGKLFILSRLQENQQNGWMLPK